MSIKEAQKDIFLSGEGDAWFERNLHGLHGESDLRRKPARMLGRYLSIGDSVLEIGCADGGNLAALVAEYGVHGHGIEPSAQAVVAGSGKYPDLDLRQGTADNLPFADGEFTLVWFGFCLYLLDRSSLMRAMAEADRVLADGGFLAITDFDPNGPRRRRYHHREGVYSWKMDYSRILLANPSYALAEKASYSHAGLEFHADPSERVATWILHKSPPELVYLAEDH
jgi:SAM-dependent methyltransferase